MYRHTSIQTDVVHIDATEITTQNNIKNVELQRFCCNKISTNTQKVQTVKQHMARRQNVIDQNLCERLLCQKRVLLQKPFFERCQHAVTNKVCAMIALPLPKSFVGAKRKCFVAQMFCLKNLRQNAVAKTLCATWLVAKERIVLQRSVLLRCA